MEKTHCIFSLMNKVIFIFVDLLKGSVSAYGLFLKGNG